MCEQARLVCEVCAGMRLLATIGEWGQDLLPERHRALGLAGVLWTGSRSDASRLVRH